jgi:archaeal flagellar protein FlaI
VNKIKSLEVKNMKYYKLNANLAEETGIHIGDGSMNIYKWRKHLYTVACHKIDDREYIDNYVLPLIKNIYNKTPKPRPWSQGTYGFRICSIDIIKFKNKFLGLPLGKKKDIRIPEKIKNNKKLMKYLIRGLFDTDGSVTIWRRKNGLYPRIYFSNISEILVSEVRNYLLELGFKVTYWKTIPKQKNWNTAHKISINGYNMLYKWMKEIGFSNPKNIRKAKNLCLKKQIL